jgi:hypothetical protein
MLYLPYLGPNSPCLPQLLPDGLCVIIILRKQVAEVFEHLNPFQHCPVNIELAPQGKGQGDSLLPLELPVHPDPAFLHPDVSQVHRVDLHAAPLAPGEVALCWDDNPIKRVDVPKVVLKHPSVPKLPRAPRHRARDLTIAPGVCLVSHARSWYQVILRHNHCLVCVMLLCQMLAEGVCHHQRIALATHNHPPVPLPSQSHPPMQPGIGVFRQLNAYPPGGANHCLRLLCWF